ncbi:D-alanine--D-alanine ligase, partial [Bienertia sinuspersici]
MGVRLKLLVNKETKKVIFAEAGKEFVDFLMGLMEIPLGSILRLLNQNNVKDKDESPNLSLEKLYRSIYFLEESYLQRSDLRNSVLDPKYLSDTRVKQAPILKQMIQGYREDIDGYVKGAATYMVMDDLTISPTSTISSLNLINIHGIRDMAFLQEMLVELDVKK